MVYYLNNFAHNARPTVLPRKSSNLRCLDQNISISTKSDIVIFYSEKCTRYCPL